MRKLLLPLAVVVAVVASSCGAATAYAAKVNGELITQDELNAELEAIRDNRTYGEAVENQLAQAGMRLQGAGRGTFDSRFVAQVLTTQIYLELVRQALEERNVKLTERDLEDARQRQEQQLSEGFRSPDVWRQFPKRYQDELAERAAIVAKLQEALSAGDVTDAAVRQYYEENRAQFRQDCTRHILAVFPGDPRTNTTPPPPEVEAQKRAQAEQWKARLDAGEDFAAIARAESGDPGTGAQGGDLGCGGDFVPEFTEAASRLQPGQISGPVRTQFGWHIIQLTERREQSLAEATPTIRRTLQGRQGSIQAWLTTAIAEADITLDPRYGRFQKGDPDAGERPGVVPPDPPAPAADRREGEGGPGQGEGGPGQGEPGQGQPGGGGDGSGGEPGHDH